MLSNVLDNDEILDQSGCACRGKESRSGDSELARSIWCHPSKFKKLTSPLVDWWTNRHLVEIDVVPFNEFNAPGTRLRDLFPEHIVNDVVLIKGKNAKERAQARKSRLISLNREFDQSLGNSVRATLNCYLWTCTKAVPKIQVKVSWAHTKTKTRVNEWMSSNSL